MRNLHPSFGALATIADRNCGWIQSVPARAQADRAVRSNQSSLRAGRLCARGGPRRLRPANRLRPSDHAGDAATASGKQAAATSQSGAHRRLPREKSEFRRTESVRIGHVPATSSTGPAVSPRSAANAEAARTTHPALCVRSTGLHGRADLNNGHSITSSARASSVGGTCRPSAFATLRLMMSANLVGCCTGRSPGFAPLRIRSTYGAACRNCSTKSNP